MNDWLLACLLELIDCSIDCSIDRLIDALSSQIVEENRSCPGDLPRCKNQCRLQDLQKRLMFVGALHPDGEDAEGGRVGCNERNVPFGILFSPRIFVTWCVCFVCVFVPLSHLFVSGR